MENDEDDSSSASSELSDKESPSESSDDTEDKASKLISSLINGGNDEENNVKVERDRNGIYINSTMNDGEKEWARLARLARKTMPTYRKPYPQSG